MAIDFDALEVNDVLVTERQFYDWQTAGGGGDVLRLVEVLERLEIPGA